MKQRMLALRRAGGRLFGLAWLTAGILVLGSEAVAPSQSSKPEHLRVASEFAMLGLPVQPSTQDFLRIRVFQEPLVPLGEPTSDENTALAAALAGYSTRQGPDDFSSLTHFLDQYPRSHWSAALLTDLGLEYYNTAHYSLALDAWQRAWNLAKDATDPKGKAIGDRAAGELAYMYSRVGRRTDLEAFFKSVEGRVFIGSATEKIVGAREALANMRDRTQTAFRCGPLALLRIQQLFDPQHLQMELVRNSTSTPKGCSLSYVAELSRKMGLNYQMAFREPGAHFIVPSVVHWKVGHYAALTRKERDTYFLEDSTFATTVWASRNALEEEASGYCLIPAGALPKGWRAVSDKEGAEVWGKGPVGSAAAGGTGCNDKKSDDDSSCQPSCANLGGDETNQPPQRMAAPNVHLSLVSLNLVDSPVGYSPPIGPAVEFTVRYSQRDAFQPATFTYANFGPKWTCDWISYITDNPSNTLADVSFYARGGGTRAFTTFDTNSQAYALQPYDLTKLRRTGPASYEMLYANGAKLVFGQSDGSVGTSRKIFLTQVVDPYGNAVVLSYDSNLRLMSIADPIGQTTTLTYGVAADIYKITQVTDPFGRFATFAYDSLGRLTNITDVIGVTSLFSYDSSGDFINALTTPYGMTTFTNSDSPRRLDILYPDGSSERVEFQGSSTPGVAGAESTVPLGMSTYNTFLGARNTIYWSRTANATAKGDYTKAKIYHWAHTADLTFASGVLESSKEALEGRVWYNYPGQGGAFVVGSSSLPSRIGRVLDDGTTQLYSFEYNDLGKMTKKIDPLGRTFSYNYASNGIDLLEVRMIRAGKNELLFAATYNSQHLPLTVTDAAGQTTVNTYNSRGQLLTRTNPKNETTTFSHDTNGHLVAVDGPLPGTSDMATATYDAYGRVRTETDVTGYSLTFDYDALDRITKVTHPDSTFDLINYDRLDTSVIQDRAGRQTFLEYDSMRQLARRTDPLGRVTRFEWCSCGDIKSLTDPLGRTTTWLKDVQNRLVSKQYGDGSQVVYRYENTTSRLREVIDEKQQRTELAYNLDDTVRSVGYANTSVPTPAVTYLYDPDYKRPISMTDGTGTTVYRYVPIASPPILGAGKLANVEGPLPNETVTYGYDELGRTIARSLNGVMQLSTFDAAGRMISQTNALGSFAYSYQGASGAVVLETFPNGQTMTRAFADSLQDGMLQRITYQWGATPISEFKYGRDIPAGRITNWSQQSGLASPDTYTFSYDVADQLLSATVTNTANLVTTFGYNYDTAANRLGEQSGSTAVTATYNALNELSTISGTTASTRTNEWDGNNRLTAVTVGSQRVEFAYDGLDRLASIRLITNNVQESMRRFVWCDDELCEERDSSGMLTKRFFEQGVRIESGTNLGSYFYTRDHLGSVHELVDSSGAVRARYSYDPFGRRSRSAGDQDADFGFAGMFRASEAALYVTQFRIYDPDLGRWLSRDPLVGAEESEGSNLYAYVLNNPVNLVDPLGLCCEREQKRVADLEAAIKTFCAQLKFTTDQQCYIDKTHPGIFKFCGNKPNCDNCVLARNDEHRECDQFRNQLASQLFNAKQDLSKCRKKGCKQCKRPDWLIDL